MYSNLDNPGHPGLGCPIRKSPDQCLPTAPRSLSQPATSFIASQCQDIHRTPLIAWPHILPSYLKHCTSLYIKNINYGFIATFTRYQIIKEQIGGPASPPTQQRTILSTRDLVKPLQKEILNRPKVLSDLCFRLRLGISA